MGEPLVKVAILIGLTHGVRAASRMAGPRFGALVLGLPSSTALWLVCSGLERGLDDASAGAEACLLGLVAATALPVAFAHALGLGLGATAAAALAAAGYLGVAAACSLMVPGGAAGHVAVSAVGVTAACVLAGRIAPPRRVALAVLAPSRARAMMIRTAVPAACLSAVMAARELAGAGFAGLLSTFPGASLAVLIATHLESGASAAGRMARRLPAANLGMVAFLATFRIVCPSLGIGPGTASGYLAAVATLAVVARCSSQESAGAGPASGPDPIRPRAPRPGLRFSPRLEIVAC